MTQDVAFKKIQKTVSDIPLVLAGTGVSIPHGIPGMGGLARHLQDELDAEYALDPSWGIITERLREGTDLESALTEVVPGPSDALVRDITVKTWEFVSHADMECYEGLIQSDEMLPLAKLLHYLTQTSQKSVDVITTNYDRLIEYACDQARVRVDDRFLGKYIKWKEDSKLSHKNIVNLLKVHGSLDYFKDNQGRVFSLPLRSSVPDSLAPDIIPPGSDKYRSVLQGIHHELLFKADEMVQNANGFLCIGYGFNDEHIQASMLERIKLGKAVIVLTKEISEKTAGLLRNNSSNYVTIAADKTDDRKTEMVVNGEVLSLEEGYWTVDGFMKILT